VKSEADVKVKVGLAAVGIVLSGVTGYFTSLAAIGERVRAAEVRQEEQYKLLMIRIDEVGSRTQQGHDDIREDLNGIHSEIMRILEKRR
jgi:hypothetical protein